MDEAVKLKPWPRGGDYPRNADDAAFLGYGPPTCSYCGATITEREYMDASRGPGSFETGVWACDRCRGPKE